MISEKKIYESQTIEELWDSVVKQEVKERTEAAKWYHCICSGRIKYSHAICPKRCCE